MKLLENLSFMGAIEHWQCSDVERFIYYQEGEFAGLF